MIVPYKVNSDLPANMRQVMPEEAQTILRKAFNAALTEYDGDEKTAMRVAWSAVSNGFEKQGDKWVRKAKDSILTVIETLAFDAVADVRETTEGFLVANPRVARTGIQDYRGWELGRPDLDKVKVYRPDTEVFQKDSLSTFAFKPVTLDHPPKMVTADNWKKYAVGQSGGDILRDGEAIRVPMLLMDSQAIADFKSKKRTQLSAGYTMDLSWEPGRTQAGDSYDAVQKSIQINHIALVKAARGGDQLRIGDSYEDPQAQGVKNMPVKIMVGDQLVQVDDDAAPVISRILKANDQAAKEANDKVGDLTKKLTDSTTAVDSATKKIAELTTAVATKDAELVTVKAQLKDAEVTPAKLDALVKDRAIVIGKAKTIVGDQLAVENKTIGDIRRQVVDAKLGDAAKGWSDDLVKASFDTLTASIKFDPLADAISLSAHRPHHGSEAARDAAFDSMVADVQNAWKNPGGASAAK